MFPQDFLMQVEILLYFVQHFFKFQHFVLIRMKTHFDMTVNENHI